MYLFRLERGGLQQRLDPRAQSRLGQLDLADVLLCEVDRGAGKLHGGLSVPITDQRTGFLQQTGFIQDTALQQHGHSVQRAGAADALGFRSADHRNGERAVLSRRDGADGAGGGLHAAGESRALKGGTHGGGGTVEPPLMEEDDLPIGPQVRQHGGFIHPAH